MKTKTQKIIAVEMTIGGGLKGRVYEITSHDGNKYEIYHCRCKECDYHKNKKRKG